MDTSRSPSLVSSEHSRSASCAIAPNRLKMLRALEKKVLWLSAWIVHHANHLRPKPDGLKVGGHQASSASVVTLMTALYFDVLRAEAPGPPVGKGANFAPLGHLVEPLRVHPENPGGLIERVIALYHDSFSGLPAGRLGRVFELCETGRRRRERAAILQSTHFTNIDCKLPTLECKDGSAGMTLQAGCGV